MLMLELLWAEPSTADWVGDGAACVEDMAVFSCRDTVWDGIQASLMLISVAGGL
jgi:hypothetical protein